MWTEIAGQHPEVLEFPPPGISCPINAHYQHSIRVSLKAWCLTPRSKKVYFSLLQTLQGTMKELNIELAAPAQRVIVENDTTQEEYLLPGKIQLEKTQDMDDE